LEDMRMVIAALTLLLAGACAASAQGYYSNRRAPGFALPDSSFKRYDLQDYRGKWLLIDFMRTDCPHCKALTGVLEKAKLRYGVKIAVLKIVLSPPDTQATVAKYIAENKVTSPMVFDMGQVAASYFNATPQKASFDTPHLFIVNPQGTIVQDFGHSDQNHDVMEGEGLFKELDQLFAGKPPTRK
jgi:peroxiredoxin